MLIIKSRLCFKDNITNQTRKTLMNTCILTMLDIFIKKDPTGYLVLIYYS